MTKTKRYYYKGNPLKQYRAFCAVARNGKMVDAADELFLSQSAISLQIRALEDELETVLFERRGPHIQITPQGTKLLEMVLPLVEGIDSIGDQFRSEVRGDLDSGEIVIAAGESTIIYILPELVARFRSRYPKVHVRQSGQPDR